MADSGWERWASRVLRNVEKKIEGRAGPRARSPRRVVAYRGFGNDEEVFIMGRVLADGAPRKVTDDDRWWHNLAAMYRHLESDEVPGIRVRVSLAGAHTTAISDDEGFYRAWIRTGRLPGDRLWHDAEVAVIGAAGAAGEAGAGRAMPGGGATDVRATGHVLVPTKDAEYGVISDLDDTVIRTDATRLLSMLRRTLLDNARTRLPFAGVAEFYTGLQHGTSGSAHNPIFYVSSSPWNLYPVLTEFLQHQSVPVGPLMLRDWGITERGILPTRHGEHKLGAIRQILHCYPRLPFVLIGDSGQEDPEIYSEVVRQFGERILAVYIRDVTADPLRVAAIGELSEEVRAAGSVLLLSDDTLAPARHAAGRGWVGPAAVDAVARAVSSSAEHPG